MFYDFRFVYELLNTIQVQQFTRKKLKIIKNSIVFDQNRSDAILGCYLVV